MDTHELTVKLKEALCDNNDTGLARLVDLHRALGPDGKRDQALGVTVREKWMSLLESGDLSPAALAALRRSGALGGEVEPRTRVLAEDIISALARRRYGPAFPVLRDLWENNAVMMELRIRAGHGLRDYGDRQELEALAGRLGMERGPLFEIAFQGQLMVDPVQARERIQSMTAEPSERAGEILEGALNVLFRDIVDDGKQHWGALRGWFDADPEWANLCNAWRELPPLKIRTLYGKERTQRIFEIAAWLRKRLG